MTSSKLHAPPLREYPRGIMLGSISLAVLFVMMPGLPLSASPSQTSSALPPPLAHYPLTGDLNDAAGRHAPMQARNAPFLEGKGLFCNGQYILDVASACDVRTPTLTDLNLSGFTISAQFLVFNRRQPTNPVFVGGERLRWLIYRLGPDGVVELGYNSNQSVPCSVKYRAGVWHEATITHDGRTTTLYLDGVAGCRTDAPLQPGNDKVILLTHFGGAATFYGLLRNLTITNGVAVPARRTPSPDTVAPPPPTDLAPVDLFLATCPTRAQIDAFDKDLQLRFDADPTKDEPLACTNAGGSRSLSPMQKRVYNTLLLMKRLQFDQPLPWTDQPLYTWLTGAIKGIRFRNDIQHSSCCVPPGVIAITTANAVRSTDRWVDPLLHGGLDGFLLVVAHEARHAEGKVHTCGTKDRTLEELGSWGVQYWLARWLAEHTDQTFFTSGPIRYTERLLKQADSIRTTQICQP